MTDRAERDARPRRRSRTVVAAVVILLVIAAGGGVYVLQHRSDEQKQRTAAQQALSDYIGGWNATDYPAMAATSTATADEISRLDQADRKALQVTAASYVAQPVVKAVAPATGWTAPYRATLTLAGLGEYAYDGTLDVARIAQQWKVTFSPTALNPRLADGTTLARTRTPAGRGRLLAADGTPLRGADAELDGNLLGTVGTLSSTDLAGLPKTLHEVGDSGGQSGLERAYDATLSGRPGGAVVLQRGGATVATLQRYPAAAGKDVRTTLDLAVQRAGESVIQVGKPAALAAVDTRTGAVLALVNNPVGGFSRVLRGQYPPGSTYKIITSAAALLAGLTEQSTIACPASVDISGVTFKNAKKESLGTITLRTAFAQSCNTAFVNLREEIHERDMKKAATLFGFDGTPPLPIASAGGTYPVPSGPVDEAASAFGQAAVVSSPLQMASVAGGVASGTWRQPFVVGQAVRSHAIPPAVDSQLQDMMRAVVVEGTAGPVAFPGTVYGKTGTAEYGSAPKGKDLPTHAWFVGYRGTVAFAVIVEGGGFGADVAAPIASRFLSGIGAR